MHTLQLLLYLVMYLVIIVQQNKLTITFNKMITSCKSDWSYLPCQPPKWAACKSTFGWSWTTVPIG